MTESKHRYFVPAALGFFELSLVDCGHGEYEIDRTPVVAWEMIGGDDDSPCCAYPVTVDSESPVHSSTPVLAPDGRVRIALDATYPNEEAWFKDASAKARRKVEAR
jgi:hypothetical protein